MTKPVPLIRASNLLPFVTFLDELGGPTDRLLKELRLPREYVFDTQTICTEYQLWSFLERAARLEGIDHLGFQIACQSPIEAMGVFGQLLMQQVTLKDCLNAFIALISLHHSDGHYRFWWMQYDGEAHFCARNPYRCRVPGDLHALEYSIVFMLNVLQAYLGETWQPLRVYLQTPAAAIWESLPLLADVELIFDHEFCGIAFPSHLLSASRPFSPPELSQQQLTQWAAYQPPLSLSASLEQILPSLVQQKVFKLDDVADLLGFSPRSLQRQLQESNTCFKHQLERARYKLAVHSLTYLKRPAVEVAYELGYASPTQFTRAFKRWAGKSPRQFREAQLNRAAN